MAGMSYGSQMGSDEESPGRSPLPSGHEAVPSAVSGDPATLGVTGQGGSWNLAFPKVLRLRSFSSH